MTLRTHRPAVIAFAALLCASSQGKAQETPTPGAQPEQPAALASPGAPVADAAPVAEQPSRFHLSLATDFTSAYYFRGIRQEDSAFIVQPYADGAFDIIRLEDATISVKFGVWNSFHAEATGSSTTDSFIKYWYEADLYAGLGVTAGKWSFDTRYYFYASPNDAFRTVEEIDFNLAYDDSELLGAWSLKPAVTLAVETGSNAADGQVRGTYLQLGVGPGFAFDCGAVKGMALTFPVTVGLSLSNYYEGTGGENDAFGYATVGAKLSIPLGLDKSWGAWTFYAGVQGLFLGDAASTFNDNDDAEIIGTVGVSVSF